MGAPGTRNAGGDTERPSGPHFSGGGSFWITHGAFVKLERNPGGGRRLLPQVPVRN